MSQRQRSGAAEVGKICLIVVFSFPFSDAFSVLAIRRKRAAEIKQPRVGRNRCGEEKGNVRGRLQRLGSREDDECSCLFLFFF